MLFRLYPTMHPLSTSLCALLFLNSLCLASPAAPPSSIGSLALSDPPDTDIYCHKTERFSTRACGRAILQAKELPYVQRILDWSEQTRTYGHLPWYSHAHAEDGDCFVVMDAAPTVHEEFALRRALPNFSQMWFKCIKTGQGAAFERIGLHRGVQVMIGPLPRGPTLQEGQLGASMPSGWFENFNASAATVVDLDKEVPMTSKMKRELDGMEEGQDPLALLRS